MKSPKQFKKLSAFNSNKFAQIIKAGILSSFVIIHQSVALENCDFMSFKLLALITMKISSRHFDREL